MTLRYFVAIEQGSAATAYGVAVPDLPGCFSAGDTLSEALSNAVEAIKLWIEDANKRGAEVPKPSSLPTILANPEWAGWKINVVSVGGADPTLATDDDVNGMAHSEFSIGTEFWTTADRKWRCTDIGTRTIIAVRLEPDRDTSWYNGPPYAVAEIVFDEYDLEGCYRTMDEASD